MKRKTLWGFSLLLFFLFPLSSWAAWKIKAQRLIYYAQTRVYVAEGQVVIKGEELTIFCSRARYEARLDRLILWGPLKMVSDGDWLEGSFAWLDLETSRGEILNGHLFLAKDRVHVLAEKMERLGPDAYRAQKALITTCDVCGDKKCQPDWSFRCRRLTITAVGKAKARHVTFNVKKVPLLYSPYVSLSVKKDRQSGFLFPRLVHGSREGFGVEVPFFWDINDSADLTFYPYYTGKRGFMAGVEGRYALAPAQKGTLRVRYLKDREKDNDYNNDGIVRTNQKRYWITGKFDQSLGKRAELHLDLDLLSDRDFLYEFAGGPLGFTLSNQSYLKEFGRGLDEINSRYRRSILWLNYPRGGYFFQSEAAYYDSQIKTQKTTMMPLPRLYFSRLTAPFLGPINLLARTEYVYWWLEEGFRGHRIDLVPEVSLSSPLWAPLDWRLAYRLRNTHYFVNWRDERGHEHLTRTLYEIDARTGLTFYRIYPFHFRNFTHLRHSFRPELRYFYRPPVNQKDFPEFVLEDRLEPINRLEYRLIQFVSAREQRGENVRFTDFLRIWVWQSYDFREATRKLESNEEQRRPFSDLFLEAELKFLSNLYVRAETSYNFYGLGLATANLTADLRNARGEFIGFDYRWDQARNVKQFNFRARYNPWRGLFLNYRAEYSFVRDELVGSTLGLEYRAACWWGTFSIYHNPDETRYSFYLNLLGIGGWGR